MRILGRRTFVTTMWCVAIFSNQFSIPALAGGDQDLRTKVLIPRQIEVQPTIASSLVVQPPFVAFPARPSLAQAQLSRPANRRLLTTLQMKMGRKIVTSLEGVRCPRR